MEIWRKQTLLAYLGYYPHTAIDGVWGNQSRKATETFQRDYQLTVDGVFGNATAARILEVIATGEAPSVDPINATPDSDNANAEADNANAEADNKTGTYWDHIRYWRREEFACRCGQQHAPYCDGYPVEPNQTLVELVDDIRAHFGRPGHPSSGIRCKQHNADQPNAVANSRHLYGRALDFYIEGVSGETLRAYAAADPRCNYAYVISGNYVHVDVN